MSLRTGYVIEEKLYGIDQWWRSNSWIYEKYPAIEVASNRLRAEEVEKVRVLEIQHSEPKEIHQEEK